MKRLNTHRLIAPAIGLISTFVAASRAFAAPGSVAGQAGALIACDPAGGVASGASCAKGTALGGSLTSQVANITNTLLLIVGAIAVIMIIIGGLRYVLSGGDESGITSAKNTILYAVIGLVVSVLAYAIVNFVLGRF